MTEQVKDKITAKLSTEEYWDRVHAAKGSFRYIQLESYKNLCHKLIFDLIKQHYNGGSILEVGAGGSDLLLNIAKEVNPPYCAGLDYSKTGCDSLEEKSKAEWYRG